MHASAILASLVGLLGLTVAVHDQGRHHHDEADYAVPDEWVDHPYHANNTHSPVKRAALGVYECDQKNFHGPCAWTKADGGACHNTIYGSGGSMGPDLGLVCRIYKDFNCPDSKTHLDGFLAYGIADYQKNGWLKAGGLGNGPASYKCKTF